MDKLVFITFTLIITTLNISLQNQLIIMSRQPSLNHHKLPMENNYNHPRYLQVITH